MVTRVLTGPTRRLCSPPIQQQPGPGDRSRPPRILVVDDDPDIRDLLSLMLLELGFEVSVAENGTAAMASAERDAPDIVILDLMLPRRSGITVLTELKSRRIRKIPVIMMSGSHEPRHRDLADQHGADGFLLKPFEEQDLRNVLQLATANATRYPAVEVLAYCI